MNFYLVDNARRYCAGGIVIDRKKINGRLHGDVIIYAPNGNTTRINYDDGRIVGTLSCYSPDGLKFTITFPRFEEVDYEVIYYDENLNQVAEHVGVSAGKRKRYRSGPRDVMALD